MKWSFSINQKAIIENGLSIDIVEAAVFDLLRDFASSETCKKSEEGGKTYFWFSWKIVCDQAPLLNLNTRQSVYKRIDSLVKNKLIDRHPNNQISNQSWYCFGENYHKILASEPVNDYLHPVNETLQPVNNDIQPCNQMFTAPVNDCLHNNIINNNIINYNTYDGEKIVFDDFEEKNQKVEVEEETKNTASKARQGKLKERVSGAAKKLQEHAFEQDELHDFEKFEDLMQKNYPELDARYYYMKIKGWIDKRTGEPAKRKIWASVVNQFITRDYASGTMQLAGAAQDRQRTNATLVGTQKATRSEIIIEGLKKLAEEDENIRNSTIDPSIISTFR